MTYSIDNAVTMPAKRNRYPFGDMAPGDSFEVGAGAADAATVEAEAKKVRNAAYQFARKANERTLAATGAAGTLKFSLRKVDTGGYRLWRVDGV